MVRCQRQTISSDTDVWEVEEGDWVGGLGGARIKLTCWRDSERPAAKRDFFIGGVATGDGGGNGTVCTESVRWPGGGFVC